MPKLRERRFPNFEVVRSDEVSLDFPPLVRGDEVTLLDVGGESVLTKGLLGT